MQALCQLSYSPRCGRHCISRRGPATRGDKPTTTRAGSPPRSRWDLDGHCDHGPDGRPPGRGRRPRRRLGRPAPTGPGRCRSPGPEAVAREVHDGGNRLAPPGSKRPSPLKPAGWKGRGGERHRLGPVHRPLLPPDGRLGGGARLAAPGLPAPRRPSPGPSIWPSRPAAATTCSRTGFTALAAAGRRLVLRAACWRLLPDWSGPWARLRGCGLRPRRRELCGRRPERLEVAGAEAREATTQAPVARLLESLRRRPLPPPWPRRPPGSPGSPG